jgi:hypothetical protein
MRNIRYPKFGIIVQLCCQIQSLVPRPVAVAWQAREVDDSPGGFGWFRLEPFNVRMLRQSFRGMRFTATCSSGFSHFDFLFPPDKNSQPDIYTKLSET